MLRACKTETTHTAVWRSILYFYIPNLIYIFFYLLIIIYCFALFTLVLVFAFALVENIIQ